MRAIQVRFITGNVMSLVAVTIGTSRIDFRCKINSFILEKSYWLVSGDVETLCICEQRKPGISITYMPRGYFLISYRE